MAEIEPLTPDETTDLLAGIAEAPVPEGLAARAVERWIEERRLPRPRRRLAAVFSLPGVRPAIALTAAAILVVVVRSRMGDDAMPPSPTTTATLSMPRSAPSADREQAVPPAPSITEARGVRPRVKGSDQRPRPSPPRAPLHARPPSVPPTADASAAAKEAAAPEPAASAVAESHGPAFRAAHRSEAGNVDLAYLNGAQSPATDLSSLPDLADARLLERITLAEDEASLADLAGKIGASSGIAITLEDSLARASLAVHCTDRPVGEVLRQMARALDMRWERSDSGDAIRYMAVAAATPEARTGPPSAGSGGRFAAGAASGMERDGASSLGGRAEPEHARKAAIRNVIGSPERVRALRQHGGTPPDAIRTEGWLIVR